MFADLLFSLYFYRIFCEEIGELETLYSNASMDSNVFDHIAESCLKKKQYTSHGKIENDVVVPESGIKIGFLKIPSIEPINDIIRNGSDNIYKEIKKVFSSAKKTIAKILKELFADIKPEIEKIIVAGNETLYKEITISFRIACNKFTDYIHKINKHENKSCEKNIKKMKHCMIKQIMCVIKKMDRQIICTIKGCNKNNLDAVIAALTKANDDVIVQINKLLDDPKNTSAIIPQILLADPVAIANLLDDANESIMKAIMKIIAKSLKKIKKIVHECSEHAIEKQSDTLNTSNNLIMEALTKEIENAMVNINKCIQRVTKKQVQKIERLEKQVPPSVPKQIQALITEIMKKVTDIIENSTKNEIKETSMKINEKNEYILRTVRSIIG
ncbi:hypothetical protein BDAP_002076 [Binucleata daphniae]